MQAEVVLVYFHLEELLRAQVVLVAEVQVEH
jgi:hypothetical protein